MIHFTLLFLAFAVTLVTVPIAKVSARKFGTIDYPKDLGIHSKAVPRSGGMAIYLGWMACLLGATLATDLVHDSSTKFLGIALAGTMVFLLGVVDDARGLPAGMRLAVQAGAGVLLLCSGVALDSGLPNWLSLPLSLVWFVGLMNAVNLLDGMDGLAAGFAIVAATAFAGLSIAQGNEPVLVLAVALIGSCAAFLRYNMHPASIFMGDGGSLLLGTQLAVLGALLTQKQTSFSWMLAPVLVLSLPLMDTLGAIVRRLRARGSIFRGDRRHVYDLLRTNGLGYNCVVKICWTIAAAGGMLALATAQPPWRVLSPPAVVWVLALAAVGAARLGLFHTGEIEVSENRSSRENHKRWWNPVNLMLQNKPLGNGIARPFGLLSNKLAQRMALRNRHVFLTDLILLPVGALAAWAIRFDGFGPEFLPYHTPAVLFIALAIPVKLPVLFATGMYSQAWRYIGRRELVALGWAVVASSAIVTALMLILFTPGGYWELATGVQSAGFPRSVILIDALVSMHLLSLVRLVAKVLSRTPGSTAQALRKSSVVLRKVLLVGAGDAGAAIASEMRQNPETGMVAVGFVDDDPCKRGIFVRGIKVLGTRSDIPGLVRDFGIEQVLLTMPDAPGWVIRETVALCQEVGVPYRTVPGILELIDGQVSVRQSREVRLEDLLRREPVNVDVAAIADYLNGARVLVTGAGGSIGSELCHQIGRFSPELLVLLGHGENSIYRIDMELRRRRPDLAVVPVVADIRDANRVRAVISEYHPEVVFHAAAHKHVPLMECQAPEVITNNVIGTHILLRASERAGVSRFIFVSTDKAANPVNLLGATKRLGEMLVCDAAHRSGCAYAAVRFGNVLGSRGSVVPLFVDQIAAGGPITVTHPEVTRYFMTIPEAAQLIIQAGALSEGGEVFILDMGEPVKIVDLVADLVRLSGLRLGQDIEITYTGLRPGEKLREELFTEEEMRTAIHRRGVLISRLAKMEDLDRHVIALGELAKAGDSEAIITKLQDMLAEYKPREASEYRISTINDQIAVASGQGPIF